jgi:phosphoribosylanthranilate isomerase
VDVSGGVESAPGRKSADKIAAFMAAVREADQQR